MGKKKKPKKTQEKEKLPRKAQRRGKKLTRKQSKLYTFKKGGPDTIIGYPTKKGMGLYKVEYKNTARNRRKYLDQNIG